VSQEVTTGMPAALFVSLSAEAQLAVVGHRGLGGFAGLVIGSVGAALAAHAACPVVVVRGPDASRQDGPIVVGLDGSPQSEAALAFAVEAAVARRVPLRAVRAWLDPAVPYVVTGPADWDEEVKRQQGLLSEQLVEWREKYPDLRVEPVLMQDRPARTLAQSTGDAQVVVVSGRCRSPQPGSSPPKRCCAATGVGSLSRRCCAAAPRTGRTRCAHTTPARGPSSGASRPARTAARAGSTTRVRCVGHEPRISRRARQDPVVALPEQCGAAVQDIRTGASIAAAGVAVRVGTSGCRGWAPPVRSGCRGVRPRGSSNPRRGSPGSRGSIALPHRSERPYRAAMEPGTL
jgi:nucleotide-binding universal stress UspA family protein